MKAEQLIVKPLAREMYGTLAELIDAHNKLVYHIFASPYTEVKEPTDPTERSYIGLGVTVDEKGKQQTKVVQPKGICIEVYDHQGILPHTKNMLCKRWKAIPEPEPIAIDWHADPFQSWEPGRPGPHAPAIRFVHNLLIAWGRTCKHVFNETTEVMEGMLKCKTCGLPYIPTGDGE